MYDTLLRLDRPASGIRTLSDDDFLRAIAWSRDTGVLPARGGGVGVATRQIRARLKRFRPVNASRDCAALWSRHGLPEPPRTVVLGQAVRDFERRPRRSLKLMREWLSGEAESDGAGLLDTLLLMEFLGDRGPELADGEFWRLWRAALTAAIEICGDGGDRAAEHVDQRLVARGEIPFVAGVLFDEVRGAYSAGRRGARALRRELLARTDTDGTPSAAIVERLAFWLAPLVRSGEWARRGQIGLWEDDEARQRFRSVVKMASPLCVAGGRMALSNGYSADRTSMLETGLRQAGWTAAQPPMRAVRAAGERTRSRTPARAPRKIRTDVLPVMQSDWARLGCLRSDWSASADTLVVTHHEPRPRLELVVAGHSLLSGAWDIELALDGQPLEINDDWACVCWHSDEDGDYLELQTVFGRGPRIERQLFLSRRDHFAVIADAISGAGLRRIDYVSRLPLAGGLSAAADIATRECQVGGGRPLARAFPLALPADRVQGTAGGFGAGDGGLELRQAGIGGLYAPIVIDWHPTRRSVEAYWRGLTVTDDRVTLQANAAAGFRLQLGKHQLLVYRALKRSDNPRAVLGHHTAHETVIGRFDASGTVTPMLYVD